MNEYVTAFLTPFSWARSAFRRLLETQEAPGVDVAPAELVGGAESRLSSTGGTIQEASDWNLASTNAVADLAGLYSAIDKADSYQQAMTQRFEGRISEGEQRVRKLEASLRAVRGSQFGSSSTMVSIAGGDTSWVDQDSRFYQDSPQLEFSPDEGCYRLPDTGMFSSIRSNGGFAGKAVIEKSLGPVFQNGPLELLADGSRSSFWSGTTYFPALVRAASGAVNWLPAEYTHGSAILLTYYLDRPTLVGEIYLDPVSTEPFRLLSVSWTPDMARNCLADPTFSSPASGVWSFSGSYRLDGGAWLQAGASIRQWFGVSNAVATTLSRSPSGFSTGSRYELQYGVSMVGDGYAGAKIVWTDAAGSVLDSEESYDVVPPYAKTARLVAYAPAGAASGYVELLFPYASTPASALFTQARLYAGESSWACDDKIDRPTTITLPKSVTTQRFSFVLQQTTPRRETLLDSGAGSPIGVPDVPEVDPALSAYLKAAADRATYPGPGTTMFAYRIGLKELDLRFREYVPRASLVSVPLNTRKEIRSVWVTADLGKHENEGVGFYVIPLEKDDTYKLPLRPFRTGEADSSAQTIRNVGDVLSIFTSEEEDAGWASNVPYRIVADPTSVVETFNGTDRSGKVMLKSVPHLRRVRVRNAVEWLSQYSVWPTSFDPNLATLSGIGSSSLRNAIREGRIGYGSAIASILSFLVSSWSGDMDGVDAYASDIRASDVVTSPGYLPIKVTVSTGRWTAYQDTYGRPDTSRVRSVFRELLSAAPMTETETVTSTDQVDFEAYLSRTKVGEVWGSLFTFLPPTSGIRVFMQQATFQYLSWMPMTLRQLIDSTAAGFSADIKTAARALYDREREANNLPSVTTTQRIQQTMVESTDTFRTRYKPLVSGPAGTVFRLYWYNPTTEETRLASPNDYALSSNTGVVTVRSVPPSGFNSLLADYKYVSKGEEEDFFSEALSFVTQTGSGYVDDGFLGRSLPICRNMTDYATGRIPVLRPPDFDRLSSTYYPVIEYYVTPGGEVVFSRDFFQYGDMPASVTVEYETLGIAPRLEISVYRPSGPTGTSRIFGTTLRTREGAPSPTRGA